MLRLCSLPLLLVARSTAFAETASARFSKLAGDYWETEMRLDPLYATYVNYTRYHDKLDDNSAAGRAQYGADYSRLRYRLLAVNRSELKSSDQISWDIMKLEIDVRLDELRQKFWQWNIDHMEGPQSLIPTVIRIAQPMRNAEDAEALLLRMKAMPAYFTNYAANLREGIKEGRVAALIPVEKTISQLDGLLAAHPQETPYAEAVKRLPVKLRTHYMPTVLSAVETHVFPAYRQFHQFLKDEYLPRSRKEKIGISDLPGGPEAYRHMIRKHITLDKTPEELHQLGLDELKEIHRQMEAIAAKMGHRGDFKSFLNKIRSEPKNFFVTRKEVLEDAKQQLARIQAKLPLYFGKLPKTPLSVEPVEEYREKNDVAARYSPPPNDLSRPGIYFINTYNPPSRPRFAMTALALHEGVPGHHLQVSLSLEQKNLPTFRRNHYFNAFSEGWGLYAEDLGEEMGMYQDDLSRVGMLTYQAWRASCLVVDTGIHALGWTRQQAIDFMKANAPLSDSEIIAEVDRTIVWPGQALSYKVGQREFLALRKESQAALGKKFDIRAFHDALLENGSIPLSVLRQRMARFNRTGGKKTSRP